MLQTTLKVFYIFPNFQSTLSNLVVGGINLVVACSATLYIGLLGLALRYSDEADNILNYVTVSIVSSEPLYSPFVSFICHISILIHIIIYFSSNADVLDYQHQSLIFLEKLQTHRNAVKSTSTNIPTAEQQAQIEMETQT